MTAEQQKYFEEADNMFNMIYSDYTQYRQGVYYKKNNKPSPLSAINMFRYDVNLECPFDREIGLPATIIDNGEIIVINPYTMKLDKFEDVNIVLRFNYVVISKQKNDYEKLVSIYYVDKDDCRLIFNETTHLFMHIVPLLNENLTMSIRLDTAEFEEIDFTSDIITYDEAEENILDYLALYNNKGEKLIELKDNVNCIGRKRLKSGQYEYEVVHNGNTYKFEVA